MQATAEVFRLDTLLINTSNFIENPVEDEMEYGTVNKRGYSLHN